MPDKRKRTHRWARNSRLVLRFTSDEVEWVKHAARLQHQSVPEFVRTSLNAELRRIGVDAVLMLERSAPVRDLRALADPA